MGQTRSNNYFLTLFLSLATTLIVGGCASVPDAPTAAAGVEAAPRATAAETTTAETTTNPKATDSAKPTPPVSALNPEPAAEQSATDEVTIDPGLIASSEPLPMVGAFDVEATIVNDETDSTPATTEAEAIVAPTIWARIRAGLRLPAVPTNLTDQHEQWFIENAEFREAMFERAKLYLYYIVEEVDKRDMPMEIALLPAIESAYKPYAYSRARASGLWQFIPSTGRLYGLKRNWWYDGRRDVIASTRAALDYLQKLHQDFNGDWQLALAAYNAGEGRVMRAVEWNRRHKLPTDFVHLRQLKRETKHYLPKLMAMANIISDPERFGIELPEIPDEPYFTRVIADSQVDLGVIARLTGMEVDDVHFINPGYTRRATDPNGPHHILVPVDKKDALVAGLNELPDGERVQWLHHQVRRGDTLYDIARRYRVTVQAIKSSNNLRSNQLRIGQSLMLPVSASVRATTAVRIARNDEPTIHRVRRGDTLSSIARRYNVLVRQLAEWNVMRPNDVLQLGRKLKVWTSDGPQAFQRDRLATVYA